TLCVAASMAELASAYPTAGGLYFWAFRLGGRGWAWLTAWLNMIGQVTITAGINVAAATYLIGAATRIAGLPADVAVPVFGTATSWYFQRSEEHTSELQSRFDLVCRLLLEKKKSYN